MLRSRVIPCLLIQNKGLVKTVNFTRPKYVGDPINAVKIFNEKEVDELIILDIDATRTGREPAYGTVEKLANECRMPLCYGGGIKTVDQAKKIIKLGVEKVAISSAILEDFGLIDEISSVIGKQSVVLVLDVKKNLWGKYEIFTHNATKKAKISLKESLNAVNKLGIGELCINSIDRDGTMKGYDLSLAELVRNNTTCPLTMLGGASSHHDVVSLVEKFKVIGAAAGSIFVFKGSYKAVLISYISNVLRKTIRDIAKG